MLKDRYASYDVGAGADFENKKLTFEDLHQMAHQQT